MSGSISPLTIGKKNDLISMLEFSSVPEKSLLLINVLYMLNAEKALEIGSRKITIILAFGEKAWILLCVSE